MKKPPTFLDKTELERKHERHIDKNLKNRNNYYNGGEQRHYDKVANDPLYALTTDRRHFQDYNKDAKRKVADQVAEAHEAFPDKVTSLREHELPYWGKGK